MARGATIIDIARAAGVSKSTVSLVLNGSPQVKPETGEAVRQAMARLGYVYNRGAANLRSPQSRVVGMVINDLTNPFFAELAVGIERALRASGTIPFLAHTAENVQRQAEVVRSMREHGASGIILSPAAETDGPEINALASLGIPIVLAIRRVAGAHVSLVASDNQAGARRVTRHLISWGIDASPSSADRERPRCAAIAWPVSSRLSTRLGSRPTHAGTQGNPTKDGGFEAMTSLLARADRPTATVCFNDVVAIGAMLALSRHGLAAAATWRSPASTTPPRPARSRRP